MSNEVETVFKKGKKQGSIYLANEYLKSNNQKLINQVLDIILNPQKDMSDPDTLEWLKFLIASGNHFQDFHKEGNCDRSVF